MTPSELLVDARLRAGLTQAEVARRARTSQPVISAYEHGRRDPRVSTLRRLLRATGAQLELGASVVARERHGPTAPDSIEDRAAKLVDVLLLAESFPYRRTDELKFPRISSS
jgi:transcriptional regulator with XRE-family HTH domain